MARITLITTLSTPDGWTLAIARQDGLYCVGTLSSHGRFVLLEISRFTTYEAANTRLMTEAAAHRAAMDD